MAGKDDVAISVSHVSKNFKLPHQRNLTLKSTALSLLTFKHRSSETQHALRDINFEVKKGEFFGIVGRNGSGKSTLLKILAGIYLANKGSVKHTGKLVPFIELGVGFNGELSGRDNVYLNGALLGFSKKEMNGMYDDIVKFAELEAFMDQKLKNYSSGMQVRLGFSLATRAKADVLLVDEVLAVGDADFQRKCFEYFKQLKKKSTTVVFVTHDMSAVREYCDRAILIDDSRLAASGTADQIASAYSRLFIPRNEDGSTTMDASGIRWGSGKVKYDEISCKLDEKRNQIVINTTATAREDTENPIFGFAIKTASGKAVLGSNTKLKKLKTKDMKAGEKSTVSWTFDNILGDGHYYIAPAIVGSNGVTIYDWWEEAKDFTVYKQERTPYDIDPEITVARDS